MPVLEQMTTPSSQDPSFSGMTLDQYLRLHTSRVTCRRPRAAPVRLHLRTTLSTCRCLSERYTSSLFTQDDDDVSQKVAHGERTRRRAAWNRGVGASIPAAHASRARSCRGDISQRGRRARAGGELLGVPAPGELPVPKGYPPRQTKAAAAAAGNGPAGRERRRARPARGALGPRRGRHGGRRCGRPGNPAVAMENGLISEAWSAISGAPSDLTFPEDFLGTWLCYSTLTRVDNLQGDELVQDIAVVNRARKDVGQQIVYPMRFIKNDQGRVVMDRAYNVVRMAEATARAYNVIDSVEWDVNDPNVLRGRIGADGRAVFFRVNQRSEEYPAPDRIETSEVAQIVFDGGDNGGYAPTPTDDAVPAAIPAMAMGPEGTRDPSGAAKATKVKSSRTLTKWARVGGGRRGQAGHRRGAGGVRLPDVVRPRVHREQGQPVTQYTYKLALFRANKYNLEN